MCPLSRLSARPVLKKMSDFLQTLKNSHVLVLVVVYLSFLLDNVLLTVVGKVFLITIIISLLYTQHPSTLLR